MQKSTTALLSILLASSMLAGCSGNNDNGGTDSGASPAASGGSSASGDTNAVEELSFEVMIPKFGVDPADTLVQEQWEKEMETYLGVKLNIKWNRIQWGDEYFEKAKVMAASGEIPDVMLSLEGLSGINDNGEEGLYADLTPYLEQYPYYKEFVNGTPNSDTYLFSSNKKIYAYFDGYDNPTELTPSQYSSSYRLDVFEQNGIKIPETLDEMYDAAKKLKELYPDTYPIGSSGKYMAYAGFYNSLHTSDDIYWNGEKYVFGPTEMSFKEALEFMHKLYAEKLMDPDYFTDEIDQARPKATTGKTFIYPLSWSGFATEFNDNEQANVKWTNALIPSSKYGDAWLYSSEPAGKGLGNGSGIVISAKAKHPELLAKMLDYQYSGKMMTLMNWGVEGTTYEEKDGVKQYTSNILNADNLYDELCKYGVGTTGSCRAGIVWTPQDRVAKYTDPGSVTSFYHDGKETEESYWTANGTYGKGRVAPNDQAPRINFTSDENEQISNTMTPVRTYVQESVIKFIKGEMDLSDWDKFQAQLKKMGDYESVVSLYQSKL
ncbi:extracellular solute-binding protein [Cohnella fermenti]|uniref:Extracellular solute-binding protein n=1 Tax=Cohnella fermenti TaxID=2565925 RepID=A0A4S4BTF4_9BACL|nr:extracellular solute-binding protein [Cohnella fermenti]THF77775.1 extracellular solute-binding protein [Cohnella fermenti]